MTSDAPNPVTDPMAALQWLGVKVSPDLAAYASGEIDISQVRCLLCGEAPCGCRQCEAPYIRFGAAQPEPCGMTVGPDGTCPRGHCARCVSARHGYCHCGDSADGT